MTESITNMVRDLCDCDTSEYRMTDFEVEFVDSVAKQLENGRILSTKQIQIVSDIWRKAFG